MSRPRSRPYRLDRDASCVLASWPPASASRRAIIMKEVLAKNPGGGCVPQAIARSVLVASRGNREARPRSPLLRREAGRAGTRGDARDRRRDYLARPLQARRRTLRTACSGSGRRRWTSRLGSRTSPPRPVPLRGRVRSPSATSSGVTGRRSTPERARGSLRAGRASPACPRLSTARRPCRPRASRSSAR